MYAILYIPEGRYIGKFHTRVWAEAQLNSMLAYSLRNPYTTLKYTENEFEIVEVPNEQYI